MTERDRGDRPEGTPDAALAAESAGARARKTTRTARRRSLRVPVDEVPRKGPTSGEVDLDEAAPLAAEPTRVERDGQMLPPASDEKSVAGSSAEEVALDLPDLEVSDAPEVEASVLESSELDASELDGDGSGSDGSALESEPTRVAPRSVVPPPIAMDGALTTPRRPSSVPPPSALGFATPDLSRPPASGETELESASASDEVELTSSPPSAPPPARTEASPARAADATASQRPPAAGAPSQPPVSASASSASSSGAQAPAVAVVVSRVVRVSAPPPALDAARVPAAPAPAPVRAETDDEPEVSIAEDSLDEVDIQVGDDAGDDLASRMTDPSITTSAAGSELTDDAEVEVADLAEPELDGSLQRGQLPKDAIKPPPPPRETSKSQPKLEVVVPTEEEELAADDLEVEGETAEKKRSAPPPPPDKPAAAPPPPKAAPPPPKAAEKPAAPSAEAQAQADAAAEARRAKKKANWWEDFFNDDYLRTVPPPNPRQISRQCDFIEGRLKLKPGSTILDVGCGLGLHAVELTRRGYLVVGLDLSLPMLSRAADEAQDQGFRINFLHADMREMNFEGAFDAVLCIGTTFGYFDDDQNKQVVERLYRALKPKGVLLLDVVNRDFVFKSQPNLVWFEGDGCVVMEETSANYITSRLHVKRTVILDDGRQRDNTYSVRLYALHELGQILHHRGFRVGEISGREATPGVFFGSDSPRLIIVAERRPQQAAPPSPPGKKAEGEGSVPAQPGESAASEASTTPGSTPSPTGSNGEGGGEAAS